MVQSDHIWEQYKMTTHQPLRMIKPIPSVAYGKGVVIYGNHAYKFENNVINPWATAALPPTAVDASFHPQGDFVALTQSNLSPRVFVYRWTNANGFGEAIPAPSDAKWNTTVGAGGSSQQTRGTLWSPSGKTLFINSTYNPTIVAYKWSSSGYGTAFSNPTLSPGSEAVSIAITPSGKAFFAVSYTSPGFHAWKWDDETGFGTKYTSPDFGGYSNGTVTVNPAGTVVAASYNTLLHVYKWNDVTGFGTKYATPGDLVVQRSSRMQFHPSGNYIAINTSNGVRIYNWSDDTGFGTAVSTWSGAGVNGVNNFVFNSTGDTLAVTSGGSSAVRLLTWSPTAGFEPVPAVGPNTYLSRSVAFAKP